MKTMDKEKKEINENIEAFSNGDSKNLSWPALIVMFTRRISKIKISNDFKASIFVGLIVCSFMYGAYKAITYLDHMGDHQYGSLNLHLVISGSAAILNHNENNYSWLNQESFITLPNLNKEDIFNEFRYHYKDNSGQDQINVGLSNDLSKPDSIFKGYFDVNHNPISFFPSKDGHRFFATLIKQSEYYCPFEVKPIEHLVSIKINGENVNFKDKKDISEKCKQDTVDITYEFE